MVEIFGVKIPVSKKVLYPKKTEVILEYINALKSRNSEAEKRLKVTV